MSVPALILVLGTLPLAIVPLVQLSAFGVRDARFAAGFTFVAMVAWLAGSVCGLLWGLLLSHPIPIIPSASAFELTAGCAALGGAFGALSAFDIPWRQRRARRWLARIAPAVTGESIDALWPRVREALVRSRTPWHVAPELGPAARALVQGGHHAYTLELLELASSRPGRQIEPTLLYAGALAWAWRGESERAREALSLASGDRANADARDAASAAVEVAEGRVDQARARIPTAPPVWIATTWRLVEASCHAMLGERERARDVLAALELADVRILAAGALPAAPIARELLSHPLPYRS